MKKIFSILKNVDYRHYLSIAITLCFVLLGVFIFPNTILRLAEACRDVGSSLAYTFSNFFLEKTNVIVTVHDLPTWRFTSDVYPPLTFLPATWEEFTVLWSSYWEKFFSLKTFAYFLLHVFSIAFSVYVFVICVSFLFLPFKRLLKRYIRKQNNNYDKESRTVEILRRISSLTYKKIKAWVLSYISFLKKYNKYLITWLVVWGLYFNVFTIIGEALAYLMYFLSSFDFYGIYNQLYKLTLDLTNVVRFVPGFIFVLAFIVFLEWFARRIGFRRLDKHEARNGALVDERGVMTVIYGAMGAGKTKLVTDMALTAEVNLRDSAFEIILESDMRFPNMNWATLEQELKQAINKRKCYSLSSVRKWLISKYKIWQRSPTSENIFGYDFEYYGIEYNDGLRTYNVWEVMRDYCQAYLIYTVQTSLIQSNYSIRTDILIEDLGNFPLLNTDFFRRDSRLMDSYSRHSHIIDFDMLRLGKRVLKNNPNRYALGFGVYVISEIDKERKNDKELRDHNVDASSKEANQRNDLFNALLKMIRHACVVSNRVFVKVLADLQRPESLGVDARELGEVCCIDGRTDVAPVLPFFAPFHLFAFGFNLLYSKFVKLYYDYRFYRGDKTALLYLAKNFNSWLKNIVDRTNNLFNSSTVKLLVESGRMNGDSFERKYFEQSKKIFSKRYSTDCLSGVFEQYAYLNTVGIDDLPEYANILATESELMKQNSFFQIEVRSYNKKEK